MCFPLVSCNGQCRQVLRFGFTMLSYVFLSETSMINELHVILYSFVQNMLGDVVNNLYARLFGIDFELEFMCLLVLRSISSSNTISTSICAVGSFSSDLHSNHFVFVLS